MVHVDVNRHGAFGSALVRLDPGERFWSESGAMYRASANVDIQVTTRNRGKGGIMAGIKRLFAGEKFFLSTYATMDQNAGEVGLSPTLQGDVEMLHLDGQVGWVCAGGSYMGSGDQVQLNTEFQGAKGMFSGESLFFIHCSGQGPLLVSGFGHISELDVAGGVTVDTSHIVAYTDTLQYTIGKAGSIFSSMASGEGLVLRFHGHGKLLVQSHNRTEFGASMTPFLPPRRN